MPNTKLLGTFADTANNDVVSTVGNQSIAGTKTFTSTITGSISGNAATATTAASCSGNAATVTNGVYTTGDQSIDGNKTFTGALSFPVTSLTNAQATAMGLFEYQNSIAYNSGIAPTVTANVSGGLTSVLGVFIPYQTKQGSWHMTFNVVCTFSSQTIAGITFTINGVTFLSGTGRFQALCGTTTNLSTVQQVYTNPGASTIVFYCVSHTDTGVGFSGDVYLNSKPTWAY